MWCLHSVFCRSVLCIFVRMGELIGSMFLNVELVFVPCILVCHSRVILLCIYLFIVYSFFNESASCNVTFVRNVEHIRSVWFCWNRVCKWEAIPVISFARSAFRMINLFSIVCAYFYSLLFETFINSYCLCCGYVSELLKYFLIVKYILYSDNILHP